ncbi:TraV family lipoprotein [Pseudoduganella eburnea]|uniref:TraV family lipoprotein n=1 Tax=Massilia eburnea TaxID=1776165 RepID=A0A6L6QCF2_9BURK|nr:TraV family lipoprotein [Massilia eburnea]MTW10162.1 TraV family lipoprotein [Massilia eburnea]
MRRQCLENRVKACCGAVFGLLMAGCGNMSGLGGSEQYGCKAPAGVQCQSVSGNYYNSVRGTTRLPATGTGAQPVPSVPLMNASLNRRANLPIDHAVAGEAGYEPQPLRSSPRILRLWIKPWEDADHDLVDQSYVYIRVDQGKWMLDHVQRQVREAYAPLRAPSKEPGVTASAQSPAPVGLSAGSTQGLPMAAQPLEAGAVSGQMSGR